MSSKRVSFGSNNGSMVETLIIDDTMPAEEQDPYQQQNGQVVVQKSTVEHVERKEESTGNVNHLESSKVTTVTETRTEKTILSGSAEHPDSLLPLNTSLDASSSFNGQQEANMSNSISDSSVSSAKPRPIIKVFRSPSTESHDNPFVKGSEIYQKADSILEHSIISRTQLSIYDPDQIQLEEMCKAETSPEAQSAPSDPNRSPNKNEINKTNGNVEDQLTAQKVEPTETGKANASQPEAKEPEEVKNGKDKNKPKCKCCVVM